MYACLYAPNQPAALELAADFSPLIERTAPDAVIFDITPSMLPKLRGASSCGLAVASNPDAAWHAARGFPGITVIAPGHEAETLAPLPLSLLTQDPQLLETFAHWGLRTFRDLAALPEDGLAERLGPAGVRLRKLARGAGTRPLHIGRDAATFEERLELDYAVTLLEPLSFLLARQLNDICARLAAHGFATNELHLTLNDETRTYRPPVPMRNPRAFLKLMQLDLAAAPPRKPVECIAMRAVPADPRSVQAGLFLPPTPEPEKLGITVARIANIVGKENVGVPEILNTHRPDAFELMPARELATDAHRDARRNINFLSLRIFRPARSLDLARVSQRIARLTGPWRTSGAWWTGAPWDRDEYDIAMADGALYRIYRDNRSKLWFFEGSYD